MSISEETFHRTQKTLQKLHGTETAPKEVRRRALEASVRAGREWHQGAIRAAYASGDPEWEVTAVFAMRWIRGFDALILDALEIEKEKIHYEAVLAAGAWKLAGAWEHVKEIVISGECDKSLVLAAIDAVGRIRPNEAGIVLDSLNDSEDEEIVEAVFEAVRSAELFSGLP